MSIRLMNMVFERYPVGGNEGMLALALADHAHDDGTRIWPSLESLARKTKQSPSSVRRHLKAMRDCGWLELVKSSDGRAGGTNEYRINPEWIAGRMEIREGVNLEPSPSASEAVDNSEGEGVNLTGEGVTAVVGEGVTAVVPESSGTTNEPSLTPPSPRSTGGAVENREQPKPESSRRERRRWRWADSRSGIEERARELGFPPYTPIDQGGRELFVAYATRVFIRHLEQGGCTYRPEDLLVLLTKNDNWSEVMRSLSQPSDANENKSPRSTP